MTLLLTPRIFVEDAQPTTSEEVPVNMLEEPDSETCLWCYPDQKLRQPDCTESIEDGDELWLNPDQPHPSDQAEPCDDEESSEPNA